MHMYRINIRRFLLLAISALIAASCAPRTMGAYTLNPADSRAPDVLEALRRTASDAADYDSLSEYGWAAWFLENDTDKALEAWKKARSLDPEGPEAIIGMGLARYFHGRIPLAQGDFLSLIESDPGGPYTEIAAAFLEEFYSHTGDFPERVQPVYERLIDDPRLSLRTRFFMTETLEKIHRELGEREKERAVEARKGEIKRWWLCGPFGSFGLIDFDRSFPPETAAPIGRSYENGGETLSPLRYDADKYGVSFGDLSDNGGVFYAVSFVRLDEGGEFVFRLVTRDLARLYVDDRPVLTVDSRKEYPRALHEAALRLGGGWHKITLKFGDRTPYILYKLHLTGPDGMPVSFKAQNEPPAEGRYGDGGMETVGEPHGAMRYWEKRLGQEPDTYNAFFAALAAFGLRDHERLKRILARAFSFNPSFAPLYLLRGFHAADDPSMPPQIAGDRAKADMRRALDLDDRQALARYQLVNDDIDRGQFEDAVAKLRGLEKTAPGYFLWPKSLFSIYESQGWRKEAEDAAEQAYRLNGRSPDHLRAMYYYYSGKSRFDKASELADRIDAIDGPGRTKAEWLASVGDYAGAEKSYLDAIDWAPENDGLKSVFADFYMKRGRLDEAESLYRELSTRPGRETAYARKIADALSLLGDREKALATLREALDREPEDFSLRQALAFHEGREILGEYTLSGDGVIADYRKENWKPDAGALIVLDEYVARIFPDGSSIGRTHIITLVRTKKAQVRYGEVFLPSRSELYGIRVIKPDGRVLVPEKISGKTSVTMPDLEPGDFVEYDYVQGSAPDRRLPGGRLFSVRFFFQSLHAPTYRSRFIVIAPKEIEANIFHINYGLDQPDEKTQGGLKVTSYSNEKLGAIIPEPFMPVEDETLPIVHVSLPVKWVEVRDLLRQKISSRMRVTEELKAFLNSHTSERDSEYETVKRLYDAIIEEIEGEDNNSDFNLSAAHILQMKKGNRLLLLSLLLKMRGIKNTFVLARPINIREIPYPNANFKIYDDALLRVEFRDGGTLFLDANYKESVFGRPSPLFSGAKALVLGEGGEPFTTLPAWSTIGDNKEVSLYVKLDKEGSAVCEAVERISGYYSVSLRRRLKKIPRDQVNTFFELILNKNFPGTSLTWVEMRNIEDSGKPIELHYTFTVRRLARRFGRHLRIEKGFFPIDLLLNYIRIPSREYPLLINGVNSGYNTTLIELPEGFAVEQAPAGRTIESPFGIYRLDVKEDPGRLAITRDFSIPIQRVEREDYMDFYKFCSEVDQLEREDFVFREDETAKVDDGGNDTQSAARYSRAQYPGE